MIAIVDDNRLFREGLKKLLESNGYMVRGYYSTDNEIDTMITSSPSTILIGSKMQHSALNDVIKSIKKSVPTVNIIVLALDVVQQEVIETFRMGVSGYLLKEVNSNTLLEAIRHVRSGGSYIHHKAFPFLLNDYKRLCQDDDDIVGNNEVYPPYHIITKREYDVLQLLAEGSSNLLIGQRLHISDKTVKNHVSNILKKMNVPDRTSAVLMSIRNKWVQLEQNNYKKKNVYTTENTEQGIPLTV